MTTKFELKTGLVIAIFLASLLSGSIIAGLGNYMHQPVLASNETTTELGINATDIGLKLMDDAENVTTVKLAAMSLLLSNKSALASMPSEDLKKICESFLTTKLNNITEADCVGFAKGEGGQTAMINLRKFSPDWDD